jgi:pyruvate kinase
VAQTATTSLELLASLNIYSDPVHSRKTRIICTIGPVSRSVEKLTELINAGMAVVRLNFSHGSHEVGCSSG